MKNIFKIVGLFTILISLTSCKTEREKKVEALSNSYAKFVDSVASITIEDASTNWNEIENYFNKKLKDVNIEADLLETDYSYDAKINAATAKYENFKKLLIEKKAIIDKENEFEKPEIDTKKTSNSNKKLKNNNSGYLDIEDFEKPKSVSQ